LISYTIAAAIEAGLFPKVYVCTDDEEIANLAAHEGANIPFIMPYELCDDLVPSHVPCQHLASKLNQQGAQFDTLLCLQPTSPLRSSDDIRVAVHKFFQGAIDFLVSVTPVDPHYFHWTVVPTNNSYWKLYFGETFLKERPLLPPVYRPNGSIKMGNIVALRSRGHFFGTKMGVIETPEERSVHVAEEFDLMVCETLLAGKTP
jgi:CMP-N-acetylneuraminic acid synthetase